MMRRARTGIAVIFFATLLWGPLQQGSCDDIDAREFLRSLAMVIYTNEDSGVNDFQVEVHDPVLSKFPNMEEAKPVAHFYWKREMGLKVLLDGVPEKASDNASNMRAYLEDRWLKYILIQPIQREFRGYRLKVQSKGSNIEVDAEAGGNFTENNAQKMHVVFDRKLKIKSRELWMNDGGRIVEEYRVKDVGGKYVITKLDQKYIDITGPDGKKTSFDVSIGFEYETIKEYSFPKEIDVTSPEGRTSIRFKNYKVNENFDETIFDK